MQLKKIKPKRGWKQLIKQIFFFFTKLCNLQELKVVCSVQNQLAQDFSEVKDFLKMQQICPCSKKLGMRQTRGGTILKLHLTIIVAKITAITI